MTRKRVRRSACAVALVTFGTLVLAGGAWGHAGLSPAVVKAKALQVFTLAVPTEKQNQTTTHVEFTPPSGFSIDSFAPSPGWKRAVQQSGSGESAVVTKVTWSGGHTPTGEDSVFQFLGRPDASKTYAFKVRQTYSDGSVVDWSGPESSDAPAPLVESRSSFGGGGSTLALVGVILGGVALVVGLVALVAGGGRRALA
jgi:uncharacterized protein YcnI